MQIFYEVLMDTGRIVAMALVSFSFCISVLILVKPVWAGALNRRFSYFYNTNKALKPLDRKFSTTEVFLEHRYWIGAVFVGGSLFVLWYTLGRLDIGKFIAYVIQPETPEARFFSEIFLETMKNIFLICSGLGLLAGLLILTKPDLFHRISKALDRTFSTEETFQTLEVMHGTLDSWVLRHHVLMGGLLLAGSIFLLMVCLKTFLL